MNLTAWVPTMSAVEVPIADTTPLAISSLILLSDRKTLKPLTRETVLEVLIERKDLIGSIVWDAWEDRAVAAATEEGSESEDIPVEEVFKTLNEMRFAA